MSKHRIKAAATDVPAGFVLSGRMAAILETAIFAVFFLAAQGWIRPELQFHNADAAVYNAGAFLPTLLNRPGGGLEWLHAQVLLTYRHPWLGALASTLLAWLGCGAIRLLLGRAHGKRPRAAHLLFAPPLFLLFGQYDSRAFQMTLGLVLALWAAVAGAWLADRKTAALRWLSPWLSLGALFGFAGLPSVLFIVIGRIVGDWGPAQTLGVAPLLNLLAATAGAVAANFFLAGVSIQNAFAAWESPKLIILGGALAGCLVATAIVLKFLPQPALPAKRRRRWPGILWAAGLGAGIWVAAQQFDSSRRQRLELDFLAENGRWPEFLAQARNHAWFSSSGRVNLLRALYHSGQLADDLFAYGIAKDDDLMPGLGSGTAVCPVLAAAMLELGQVNQAEHFAHEALEIFGERPALLWRLAQINILKGYPLAAGNYLRVIRRQDLQPDWARQCLEQLEADPRLERDPEISALRAVMVATDWTGSGNPTGTLMQQLLHTNPTNRMAFEFLMAHYLVTAQLEKFMENLGRIKAFPDPALPRHYEEASLLANRLNKIPLPALPIRETTRQRYARFDASVKNNLADLNAVRPELARDYGDTYWFFFLYGGTAKYPVPEKGTP